MDLTKNQQAPDHPKRKYLRGDAFKGKWPKVRIPLKPEDVMGQRGQVFDEEVSMATRKPGRR